MSTSIAPLQLKCSSMPRTLAEDAEAVRFVDHEQRIGVTIAQRDQRVDRGDDAGLAPARVRLPCLPMAEEQRSALRSITS